jgi:hypothetical protein
MVVYGPPRGWGKKNRTDGHRAERAGQLGGWMWSVISTRVGIRAWKPLSLQLPTWTADGTAE